MPRLPDDRAVLHLELAEKVGRFGSWEGLGRAAYVSPNIEEMLELAPGEEPSLELLVQRLSPDDGERFVALRAEALAGSRSFDFEAPMVLPSGRVVHVRIAAQVERDAEGTPTNVVGIVQDVTVEVEDRERLTRSEAVLGALLHRQLTVSERERVRLAGALRDGPVGHLTAAAEALGRLDTLDEDVERARQSVARARAAMAEIADRFGQEAVSVAELAPALTRLARFGRPHRSVRVELGALDGLDDGRARAVLRIAEEALRNALRHGSPRSVSVTVGPRRVEGRDGTALRVVDDGVGFDLDAYHPRPGHLGLTAMRERCTAVGGVFGLASSDAGTTVDAWFPRTDRT